MNMSTKEDYEEDIKKLFESWKNKSPSGRINHRHNGFIEDGIVNTEEWFSNNKGKENENRKILLVLKEAYGLDTSLIDFIRNQSYESAPKIWKRISQIVDGILETTVEKIKPFSENITYNYNEIINNIAVINLKKSDGKSTSDCDEILEYARYDGNEIKKQINMIKPNIIIFGSTFWIVNEIYHDKLLASGEFNH